MSSLLSLTKVVQFEYKPFGFSFLKKHKRIIEESLTEQTIKSEFLHDLGSENSHHLNEDLNIYYPAHSLSNV